MFLALHMTHIEMFFTQTPHFVAQNIDMPLTGSKFWEEKSKFHGFQSTVLESPPVCANFFSVWPGDCVEKFDDLDDRLRMISAQMTAMNSTYTLYTTDNKQCVFNYPGVSIETFNSTEILVHYGFEPAFPRMSLWRKTRFTRISDILRMCLAHRFQKSYIDTDVHFLQLDKSVFEKSYVGAAMWGDLKNAIEISNAAFCLPRVIVEELLSFQLNRILHGSENFFYTELGPSAFHNVLLNRHAIALYSQNHPAEPSMEKIAESIHHYGHRQLHLTGHVRKGNSDLAFSELVNAVRRKAGLPQIALPPTSR